MVIEDPTEDVRGVYTAAMLAELLGISVSAIRRWVRRDYLFVSVEVHLTLIHISETKRLGMKSYAVY